MGFKLPYRTIIIKIGQFEASKIENQVISGGRTSELQSLNVCVNKPLKDRNKQYWQSWFVDKNSQVMTNGDNTQKPVYEVWMGWLGQCHTDLSEQRLMI